MDRSKALDIFAKISGRCIDTWEVCEFINNGKSAAVYKGRHGEDVAAIKIFDSDLLDKFGEDALDQRVLREKSLIGHDHPNLIRVIAAGIECEFDLNYLIMEFLEGQCLQDCLDDVPFENIPLIISQLASAAEFLEGRGLAHRDIKPANIVISPDFQIATLLDLGVLRPIGESELTDHGSSVLFVGTNQYASPEFALRKELDTVEGWRAVTFYQLGAVLHDLIMRRPLFADHLGVPARLAHAVQSEVVEIRSAVVPPWLVTLAQNCLVKDPSTRLRLVNWGSFRPKAPKQDPLLALQETIRQRAAASMTVHDERKLHVIQAEPDAAGLEAATGNFLQETLRAFGRMDPPLGRRIVYQDGASKEIVRCDFEPAARIGLPDGLSICLRPEVVDAQSKIIRISGCPVDAEGVVCLDDNRGEIIYEGNLDEDSIEERIAIYVLLRVDEAQVAAVNLGKGA